MKAPIRVAIFGPIGIIAPWLALFLLTYRGVSEISTFNCSMLLMLSMLVVLFLIINSVKAFNDNQKRVFIFGLALAALSLISFLYNLLVFVSIK